MPTPTNAIQDISVTWNKGDGNPGAWDGLGIFLGYCWDAAAVAFLGALCGQVIVILSGLRFDGNLLVASFFIAPLL